MLGTAVRVGSDAKSETFDWGTLVTYFAGDSYAATDSLTAIAIIKPGMEIHPPHVHSEEEYLMVLEGEGTWSVKGEEFPAEAGDTLRGTLGLSTESATPAMSRSGSSYSSGMRSPSHRCRRPASKRRKRAGNYRVRPGNTRSCDRAHAAGQCRRLK